DTWGAAPFPSRPWDPPSSGPRPQGSFLAARIRDELGCSRRSRTYTSPPVSLHLVDVSTYLFRAYHKLPPTITLPDKRPANALYGLLSTLAKLVRERSVKRIAAVLDDVAADDERIALHPGYKVSRRDFPEDLAPQAELAGEALAAAGFAVAWARG